jgi:hypothetical protein
MKCNKRIKREEDTWINQWINELRNGALFSCVIPSSAIAAFVGPNIVRVIMLMRAAFECEWRKSCDKNAYHSPSDDPHCHWVQSPIAKRVVLVSTCSFVASCAVGQSQMHLQCLRKWRWYICSCFVRILSESGLRRLNYILLRQYV